MCPNELQTHTSTRRFEVSEAGMRELNAGRDPWDLVKELVPKLMGRSSNCHLLQRYNRAAV